MSRINDLKSRLEEMDEITKVRVRNDDYCPSLFVEFEGDEEDCYFDVKDVVNVEFDEQFVVFLYSNHTMSIETKLRD